MKSVIFLCLLILFISSCNKSNNNPVAPTPEIKYISLEGYGALLDSFYYKEWSDNSWEQFNEVVSINGRYYVSIINSDGVEYYYDVIGYAGFKPSGENLILFDKALSPMPDTIIFNHKYSRETTFYYQGYNYKMVIEQTLADTVSVSVPFGIFNKCLWFKMKSTLSAGGQSETQNTQAWLAVGPSDIKQTLNNGTTLVMVKGIVNGEGWGMELPKIKQNKDEISTKLYYLNKALYLIKHLNIKLNNK